MLGGKSGCIVGVNVVAGGNDLFSTPNLFKYRPMSPHVAPLPDYNIPSGCRRRCHVFQWLLGLCPGLGSECSCIELARVVLH